MWDVSALVEIKRVADFYRERGNGRSGLTTTRCGPKPPLAEPGPASFEHTGNREDKDIIRALAALAHELRLRIFRRFVVAGPDGLTPGVFQAIRRMEYAHVDLPVGPLIWVIASSTTFDMLINANAITIMLPLSTTLREHEKRNGRRHSNRPVRFQLRHRAPQWPWACRSKYRPPCCSSCASSTVRETGTRALESRRKNDMNEVITHPNPKCEGTRSTFAMIHNTGIEPAAIDAKARHVRPR